MLCPFQVRRVKPPNLLPCFVLINTTVEFILLHNSWNINDESLFIDALYNKWSCILYVLFVIFSSIKVNSVFDLIIFPFVGVIGVFDLFDGNFIILKFWLLNLYIGFVSILVCGFALKALWDTYIILFSLL